MISLDRGPAPPVLDLDDSESKGAKEKARAIQRFDDGDPMKSEDFKAYKHATVRSALTALSHGKCAYCESDVAGSSQTDIEHYRPKGAVKDHTPHPGYYWLAMDWENLVLSCMHCNQQRKQVVLDDDASIEEIRAALERGKRETVGKKNAFPTLDDHWVTSHHGDVGNEKPALIDPTKTDPAGMFEWVYGTNMICTMRGLDPEGRAQATIDTLGFNRRYLTEARMKKQAFLNRHARQIRKFLRQYVDAPAESPAQQQALTNLMDELNTLKMHGGPEQPFSAMAKDFYQRQVALVNHAIA